MTFLINRSTKETARIWSDSILRTGLTKTPNYTGLEHEDRFYIGYIGELTFRNALCYYGKSYIFKPRIDGKPDQTDFRVCDSEGEERSLNIKTASKEHHRHFMLPDSQFRKYRNDYYVAAHVLGDYDEVRFEGWTTHKELEKCKPKEVRITTKSVPFTELRDIESLFDLLL